MDSPLPNFTLVTNFLSMVLAATDNDHGETFVILPRLGPELPPEFEVRIPFFIAWKAPIAIESLK